MEIELRNGYQYFDRMEDQGGTHRDRVAIDGALNKVGGRVALAGWFGTQWELGSRVKAQE